MVDKDNDKPSVKNCHIASSNAKAAPNMPGFSKAVGDTAVQHKGAMVSVPVNWNRAALLGHERRFVTNIQHIAIVDSQPSLKRESTKEIPETGAYLGRTKLIGGKSEAKPKP